MPVVRELFDSLKAQFGSKMGDLWEGVKPSAIEQEWALGLAGFQKGEIARGLAACATRPFAPNLGEFARLCRPCVDPEYAFWEAHECLKQRDQHDDEGRPLRGDWTHPAAFFAAVEMSTEVRSGDWQKARTRWTRLLARELARGFREIPMPAMRVNYDARTGPPNEAERRNIARVLAEGRREIAKKQAEAKARMEADGTLPTDAP